MPKLRVVDEPAIVQQDLLVPQGADFSHGWRRHRETVNLTAADFTGACQVRKTQKLSGELLAELTVSIVDDPDYPTDIWITVSATHAESDEWLWMVGHYQIELDGPYGRERWAMGQIRVSQGVTD
jgi:hypothetical protein